MRIKERDMDGYVWTTYGLDWNKIDVHHRLIKPTG
jgi:hypothetical protein